MTTELFNCFATCLAEHASPKHKMSLTYFFQDENKVYKRRPHDKCKKLVYLGSTESTIFPSNTNILLHVCNSPCLT